MWRSGIVLIAAVSLFAPTPSGNTATPEPASARGGDIWTIGADGTRARPLLRDAAPAWSPDGSRLALVSGRSGDEEIDVARR